MGEDNNYHDRDTVFGSWHVGKRIGGGAAGDVYEITRDEYGARYTAAVKVITIPQGPDDIQRVLSSGVEKEDLEGYYEKVMLGIVSELRFLSALKGSTHIVSYEDHQIIKHPDAVGWDILIKTELLTSLAEHGIENDLKESDVLKLGIDICKALEYCHKQDIIHRDIKPENIFITSSGDYKLGDFGVARVLEETQMTLTRRGTYSYIAPEVFHGHHYGYLADIYSLGLVMYKYLNHGRNPFMPAYPEKLDFDDAEAAFVERMSGTGLPAPDEGSAKIHKCILKACKDMVCVFLV